MSVVLMSKRELNRLDVLVRLDSDKLTVTAAAGVMNVTPRQAYRLLGRYRDGGAPAIADRRRGRPSNNRLPDAVRDHAVDLVRTLYPLGQHWPPRSWRNVMISGYRERRYATGCGELGFGPRGLSAFASSSLGIGANMLASWFKSMARTIAGSKIVHLPARYWCSSMMRPVA